MKIVFTGGGSVGHVLLNVELIKIFLKKGYEIYYIGSKTGIEKEMISNLPKVTYYEISVGKLRRYLSKENIKDIFKVIKGIIEAHKIINRLKPKIIFSKGGFVSFPVCVSGRLNNVPIIIHESDFSVGLANKLSFPLCTKMLLTFKNKKLEKKKKCEYVGAVVHRESRQGNRERGQKICHFNNSKPNILVMGGGLGSNDINKAIWNNLDTLLKDFNIIHICGKGKKKTIKRNNYFQLEFLLDLKTKEVADILALSDMVVSRAGANAIFEFLYAELPMLLIPLPKNKSRGEQTANAKYFENKGFCYTLENEKLGNSLLEKIYQLNTNKSIIKKNIKTQNEIKHIETIVKIIEDYLI